MTHQDKKFVIQAHTLDSRIHWDFMLEWGPVLRTYRLDKSPADIAGRRAGAVKIADHPLKFLSYEGPVNDGRGSVRIVEAGTYEIIKDGENRLELALNGEILKGKYNLIQGESAGILICDENSEIIK